MLAQHRAHIFQSQPGVVQLGWIDVHSHARQRAASDIDLTNTFNLKQSLLHDGGCRVVKLAAAVDVRGKRYDDNRRVGRINFPISRVLREVRGKICACRVDRRLHIARRAVDVAIQIELERNRCRT